MNIDKLLGEDLTAEERMTRLANVAIKSPEHLKAWLEETNRKFLVFKATDLVDALSWPDGVEALMQIIAFYRGYRQGIPSDCVRQVESLVPGVMGVEVVFKSDQLEVSELDTAIRYLIGLVTKKDSNWQL